MRPALPSRDRQRDVGGARQAAFLRIDTSGLTPDDRVVVGNLQRASPGTKATPQLTTIE